jgi:hypothetical protein
MTFSRIYVSRRLLALVAILAVSACGESTTSTRSTAPNGAQLASSTYGATILECPVDVSAETVQTIGILGGEIALNGHRLVIPAGALTKEVTFKLVEPAGNYVVIEITANGAEHITFESPASLSVSYSRCDRSNIEKKDLRVYYVDADSGVILEDLGGADDKAERRVTVETLHLSEYAVGSP